MLISTLQEVLRALDGELRPSAVFPEIVVEITQFLGESSQEWLRSEAGDGNLPSAVLSQLRLESAGSRFSPDGCAAMNRFPKILLALTLTSALLLQPACQAESQAESQADGQDVSAQPAQEDRAAKVDSLFAHLARLTSPGVAVVVVKDGEVLLRKGYGSANLEYQIPIAPTTVFDIASVSKQFTGMAIAMLVEEGAISLDDDVRSYIPQLPDFGHVITIDHLVHHISGIRDWPGTLAVAGWRMDDVISFDQILRMAFTQQDLNFQPGAEYTYSNTGFNLLAEVVARVSGMSFREWTDENIFQPLGMTNTHFQDDHTEIVPNRAYGYAQTESGEYAAVPDLLTALGSSSLFTTVDDLSKWLMNFDDAAVGGPAVIERMKTRGRLNDGSQIQYAFGINVADYKGRPSVSHGGSWAGFRTYLLHFPEERLGVAVLGNDDTFNSTASAQAVADIYLGVESEVAESAAAPGQGEEGGEVSVLPAVLEEYVGTYRLGPGWYVHINRRGDSLVTQATAESEFPMVARSDTEFWVEDYGASITFQRDATGEVENFLYREMEAPKVSDLVRSPAPRLADFTGTYVSEELDTDYEVVLEGDTLVAHHRRHGSIHLFPAWGDDFRGSVWFIGSLEFQRGADGAVTGFLVNGGERVRNLWFVKR
jgi:CubicO group peptidase (beta-lactamase class C family)